MTGAGNRGEGAQEYLARLDTRFSEVPGMVAAVIDQAIAALSEDGLDAYLEAARQLGKLGRGVEPMLAFLATWPTAARSVGEESLPQVMATVMRLQRSPNSAAIGPFLRALGPASRRLQGPLGDFLDICLHLMEATSISIHGHHTTIASPSLTTFLETAPRLLDHVGVAGLRRWVDYGIRNYPSHPGQQRDYFALQTPDSKAVLARQRQGTTFAGVERKLSLYLRALWGNDQPLIPYSRAFDEIRQPVPYFDALGMRIPDAYQDSGEVSGLQRYFAALAHMTGHQRWSRAQVADNLSPFQRLATEFFEDARIDALLCRQYPGLRRLLLALHPRPVEGACDPEIMSCLRHRLATLSRACIDPDHPYTDPLVLAFVRRFDAALADGGSTRAMADLARAYVTQSRRASDQLANVWFEGTEVDYRDDNRHLWHHIEEGDEEGSFEPEPARAPAEPSAQLPPHYYPEWDYTTLTYRPDWVSVYEGLHPSGQAADIDALLDKHAALAKHLKRLLDLLKPQEKVRIRFQEEGNELDLDIALRSLIDFRCGSIPDPRINMSHRTDGRNIAVMLLLDLSESLASLVPGSDQSVLELSQEAVSLLAWAIEQLGDPFAIAGFHSNTRQQVRYLHLKSFSEHFGDDVKARLAAMQAGWSTRLGAGMRHAGHYLASRKADKLLLLVLTDGEPSDVDVTDERLLVEDARRAVMELEGDAIFTYCISLDPRADNYVSTIFGKHYTVIDNIARLPERLPELFMALTS